MIQPVLHHPCRVENRITARFSGSEPVGAHGSSSFIVTGPKPRPACSRLTSVTARLRENAPEIPFPLMLFTWNPSTPIMNEQADKGPEDAESALNAYGCCRSRAVWRTLIKTAREQKQSVLDALSDRADGSELSLSRFLKGYPLLNPRFRQTFQ